MAIANSDGSIILSTKVDTSGMEQGTKSLKSQAAKLAAEYRKAGMSQSEAFKKAWSEIERTRKETDRATKSTKNFGKQSQKSGKQAKGAFDGLKSTLQSLAGYLALAFSVTKLISFSNEAGQLATQTEASVQRLVDIYGSASDSVGGFIDANARALGMSKAAAASFSSVYGNLFSVWADQATNAELTNRYLNMTAVVASKTGRTVEDVQERIRSGLLGNTEAIEDLGIFVNVKTIEMTDAFQRMADGKSWEQLDAYTQQQVRSMAILEQATSKYGDEVANTSATIRNRFNAAYQDFQNSWGNIVNTVLLPVLETLTKVFDIATKGLNALSGRSGQILESVELQEEKTNKTAENIEEQIKNQKDLNKEIKKTRAGFDDLEILTNGTNSEEDNISNAIQNSVDSITGLGVESATSEFDAMGIVKNIKDSLDYLIPVIELGLVAIGLIVLSTGNIPLGIGFIATGAYLYSVTERSEGSFDINVVKEDLQSLADWIEEILVTIGIILLLLGQVPWGIGFILAGAIVYGVKEVSSEEYDTASFKEKLAVIVESVSTALIAIGVLLILFGHIPLGIGFLVAGKKLLDITEEKLQEGEAQTKLQKFFEDNQSLFVGVALALVVLGLLLLLTPVSFPIALGLIAAGAGALAAESSINGTQIVDDIKNFLFENSELISLISRGSLILGIILCFVPGALPLAISLIAAGAVGLVTVTALNWNAIITTISAFVFENSELIALISGGLLILGILICFVNLPLGIALIVDGVAGLVTVTALNWNSIVDWVKGAWEAVKGFWNKYIAPVFTAEWWLNLGKACINGLIAGFEGGINGIIIGFESMINWIVDALNTLSFDIPDWVPLIGGESWGINIPRANFDRVSIPRLAQGAVIPPNREFLAVLGDQKQGTNIEAPLQTIVDAFNIALQNNGTGQTVKEEHYYLSETELMTILHKLVKGGERLQGNSLISSGGVY